jgi:hypothetical protein
LQDEPDFTIIYQQIKDFITVNLDHKSIKMKTISRLTLLLLILVSCNSKKEEEKPVIVDSVSTVLKADTTIVNTDAHYFWVSDLEQGKGLVMKRDSPVSADSLTPALMIGRLNSLYPEIPLEYLKTSTDSIFVKIGKSNYLTQKMGTSGAEAYLAEVTYNLTELKNINFVNIRFKEGDHATPGTYSRVDFVHVKE